MQLIIRILINAVGVLLVAYVVPGIRVAGFGSAVIAAIVIGLINAFVRPVLGFLSIPITVLTLGLFTLVLNALLFWLAAKLTPGFTVTGFWAALIGAILFWLFSWLTNAFIYS